MNLSKEWTILFCSQCSEPTPPSILHKPFAKSGLFCPECLEDIDESEMTYDLGEL